MIVAEKCRSQRQLAAVSSTVYTATFTPTDNSTTDGVISVASSKFSDAAGNNNLDGSDANNSVTFTVNTVRSSNGITIAQTGSTSGSDLLTTEAGSSTTFTVVLDAQPTADVTVSIAGLDTSENSLDTDTLTFTTANWNTPQTVTVTGVDDTLVDGDITTTLTATASNTGGYAGTETATTTVKNTDDDSYGITIAQTGSTSGADLLTTEAGSSSSFTVVLDAQPTADVTGVDDTLIDGDITTTLTATASNTGGYAGTETATTTVKNTDDDSYGITIAQTGNTSEADLLTTETGGSSTFTVVLDAQPTDTVTVSISGLDTTENSLNTDTLTFTTANWNTPQTITVTGVDDTLVDGDITTTLTATASNTGGYAGTETATTTVKNTDDDSYGITIAQTGSTSGADLLTTEAGSSTTFTVVLDAQPTDTVTVSIAGLDTSENSLNIDTLTFTTANWNTPQTITVTGVDGTLVDGDITTTLTATASNTGGYAGTESATTTVRNTDDDTGNPFTEPTTPALQNLDNTGLIVEGSNNTGLWVQLTVTDAKSNWQNTLDVHSSKHDTVRSIGATKHSENLGFLEIYVETGETISFSQHSNLSDTNANPSLIITGTESEYTIKLNDRNNDTDFDDLTVKVTTSLEPVQPKNIPLTSQQTSNSAAIYDFSTIDSSGLSLDLRISSDCDLINQLAFVQLDIDPLTGVPYSDYRIGGISPEQNNTYQNMILQNLVHPTEQAIVISGQQSKHVNWNLIPEDQGFYAPVLITPGQEVFTTGLLSASDGLQHAKLLGQNFIGFEDLTNKQSSDWDFNDVTILASVTT